MSAADDFPEIAQIAACYGVRDVDEAEEQARMILAEVDVLRARINLKEAELAAAEVALRTLGYRGALTQ